MTSGKPSAPTRLTEFHNLEPFSCGEEALDIWLKKQALKNETSGASRTYVVSIEERVIGYYCLANGAIDRSVAPKPMQRNMPDPIPVMVLGRLAGDKAFPGRGLGRSLLFDAVARVLEAAEIAGIKAILVHAISPEAKRFYQKFGFLESPIEPMTLCLPLNLARQGIARLMRTD